MTRPDRRVTDQLLRTLEEASAMPGAATKEQLSHRQMLVLAYAYLDWAGQPYMTEEQAIKLLGWARGLRLLAETVGEDWSPPEPERLSLIGFLARNLEK